MPLRLRSPPSVLPLLPARTTRREPRFDLPNRPTDRAAKANWLRKFSGAVQTKHVRAADTEAARELFGRECQLVWLTYRFCFDCRAHRFRRSHHECSYELIAKHSRDFSRSHICATFRTLDLKFPMLNSIFLYMNAVERNPSRNGQSCAAACVPCATHKTAGPIRGTKPGVWDPFFNKIGGSNGT